MPAVVEARSILCAVPLDTDRGETRGVWLQRCASFFGLSNSEASKIYYRRKERMDADKLALMRERLNQLQESAAKRRGNNESIKERLAYLRSDKGSGDAGRGSGGTGAADGRGLGAGEGGGRESGGPATVARSDAE